MYVYIYIKQPATMMILAMKKWRHLDTLIFISNIYPDVGIHHGSSTVMMVNIRYLAGSKPWGHGALLCPSVAPGGSSRTEAEVLTYDLKGWRLDRDWTLHGPKAMGFPYERWQFLADFGVHG